MNQSHDSHEWLWLWCNSILHETLLFVFMTSIFLCSKQEYLKMCPKSLSIEKIKLIYRTNERMQKCCKLAMFCVWMQQIGFIVKFLGKNKSFGEKNRIKAILMKEFSRQTLKDLQVMHYNVTFPGHAGKQQRITPNNCFTYLLSWFRLMPAILFLAAPICICSSRSPPSIALLRSM